MGESGSKVMLHLVNDTSNPCILSDNLTMWVMIDELHFEPYKDSPRLIFDMPVCFALETKEE